MGVSSCAKLFSFKGVDNAINGAFRKRNDVDLGVQLRGLQNSSMYFDESN